LDQTTGKREKVSAKINTPETSKKKLPLPKAKLKNYSKFNKQLFLRSTL
jgi:hypothetical protein